MEPSVRDRVAAMLPELRASAARTEAERRVPEQTLDDLVAAGIFGPTEPAVLLGCVRDLSAADGSTGWVAAHLAAGRLLLGLHGEAGSRVQGHVSFSLQPAGRLEPRSSGAMRLTGRWPHVTACRRTTWLLLAAEHPDGHRVLALVPTADVTLHETWHEVGLVAAEAHDVEVSDVEVRDVVGLSDSPGATGVADMVGATVAMAVVGAAGASWERHVEQTRERLTMSHGGEDVAETGLSPARIGRAASEIDGAALELSAPFGDVPDGLPDELAADPHRDQSRALSRAAEAVGVVFDSARGHALTTGDDVARFWRDVKVGAHHARDLLDLVHDRPADRYDPSSG